MRADRLVGQVLGAVGKLPAVYVELEIKYFCCVVCSVFKASSTPSAGVDAQGQLSDSGRVQKLAKNEILKVNIGSTSIGCKIILVKEDVAKIVLTHPACTEIGEKLH